MQKKNILKIIGLTFAGFLFLATAGNAEGALLKQYYQSDNTFLENPIDWSGNVVKIIINAPAGSEGQKYMNGFYGGKTYLGYQSDYSRLEMISTRLEPDGSQTGIFDGTGDSDIQGGFLGNKNVGDFYPSRASYLPAVMSANGIAVGGNPLVNGLTGSTIYLYSSAGDDLVITPPSCDPDTIENGTIGEYPTCAITCNSGFVENAGVCEAIPFSGLALGVSTSTAGTILANITSSLADSGMLNILALIIGLNALWVIIKFIIGLFSKPKVTE